MMKKDRNERFIGTYKALSSFGGFVQYYDTTEALRQLAALVSSGNHRNILACCGGGDQALTMLGAAQGKGALWAVDINPSQLFILAAKASWLRENNAMPTFGQIQKTYPGRIAAIKKNFRYLQQMYIYNVITGKKIMPPTGLAEKYKVLTNHEMFFLRDSGPFWKKDELFIARVRSRLDSLKFARMDIFDSTDYFKQGVLDLIYLSDIFMPEALPYYHAKLARMTKLLRPGGWIISCLDEGDEYMGLGISPGRMLARQARELSLKIVTVRARGYIVLEQNRRK